MRGKSTIKIADQLALTGGAAGTLGPFDIGTAQGIALHGLTTGNDVDIVVNIYPLEVEESGAVNFPTPDAAVTLADGVPQIVASDNMKLPHSSLSIGYTVAATDATVLDLVLVMVSQP